MSDITIICCYSNEKIYNNFLDSLKTQTCNHELIGIDNTGNKKFSSCSSAYNSVLNQIRTKYVIFSHQDILFNKPDSLAKFLEYLDKIAPHDILGVAGVKFNEVGVFANILHKNKAGEIIFAGDFRLQSPMMECDTLDECFFGGYSEHFRANPFDEKICNNWHLYAVDACLNTKAKSGHVFICDPEILHLSAGNLSMLFHYEFYRLCGKYSKIFPVINTTCTTSKTDFINRNYYLFRFFRHYVKVFILSHLKL